jgi:hypothetical protein
MDLSTAKLLDNTRAKQKGCQQEANKNVRNVNNATQNQGRVSKPLIKYTGPNMVMQSGMRFSTSDRAKLTKEQKAKNYEFNKQR